VNAPTGSVALSTQTDLDCIEAEPAPLLLRLVTLAVAFFLLAAIALAAATHVDMDVTGRGRLESERPLSLLQPLDRAIVRTLLVRAGDVVVKGQLLATLDPTFAAADLQELVQQRAHLLAEADRLHAEATGALYLPGPLSDDLQSSLSAQRLREYRARLSGFDQTLAQDQAQQVSANDHVASLQHQVVIAEQVLAMRNLLMQSAVGSRLQYLDAAAAARRLSGELEAAQDQLAELEHARLSHQAERQTYIEGWRRDIADAITKNRDELDAAEASLAKAKRLQQLVQVVAPVDGVVLDVAARGPGSVLREAEPLLTLLPANGRMTAEVNIKSADIGYIRLGDNVTLKIDAYPYQFNGVLRGHVRAIAAASVDAANGQGNADGTATHRVSVEITGSQLTNLPRGTSPMPGMTVAADVRVGTRSVLAYFLTPLTRGFAQSLREP